MNRYILFPLCAMRDQLAIARHDRDVARQRRTFALTALRIERNDMYMHFWRTKGTLPGIIANVKAASPGKSGAAEVQRPFLPSARTTKSIELLHLPD